MKENEEKERKTNEENEKGEQAWSACSTLYADEIRSPERPMRSATSGTTTPREMWEPSVPGVLDKLNGFFDGCACDVEGGEGGRFDRAGGGSVFRGKEGAEAPDATSAAWYHPGRESDGPSWSSWTRRVSPSQSSWQKPWSSWRQGKTTATSSAPQVPTPSADWAVGGKARYRDRAAERWARRLGEGKIPHVGRWRQRALCYGFPTTHRDEWGAHGRSAR